ncbi:MAG: lysostaphin resistance A-like protein, partial [Planctomycetia bacterium]|nr:lysostaphin resistance A-like protein [Planctomycetia bacterium]
MDNPQESNGVQLLDETQEPACPQEQDSMHQSNQTQTPDSTIRNVPWGLWDAFLIAMVFFFAPCLLLTLILFLPQGHLFFLPNIENEPAIIWSSPKPQSAQSQTPSDKDGICQEELVLEFAEGTPCSHDTQSDSSATKITNSSQVETAKKNTSNHVDGPSSDTDTDTDTETETDLKTEHPLTQLLVQAKGTSRYWWSVLFAFLAGVVAAPIVEEFLFRVVLQGALERKPDREFSVGAARRR